MLSLDPYNLICTIINIIVLLLLVKLFLFKPVDKMLKAREELLKKQYDEAEATKQQANALKVQYEASIEKAKEESEEIISQAKVKAQKEYDAILKSADEDASKMIEKAQEKIAAEKAETLRNMKTEIAVMVMGAAAKVMEQSCDTAQNQKIYDQFLAEAGEESV